MKILVVNSDLTTQVMNIEGIIPQSDQDWREIFKNSYAEIEIFNAAEFDFLVIAEKKQTDPRVNEECIDKDKELREIKQVGEKEKLSLPRQLDLPDSTSKLPPTTPQQEACNTNRAEEPKTQQLLETVTRKVFVRNPDGTTKIINETATQRISAQSPVVSRSNQYQRVQVMKSADGKLSVKGLNPNQKLVQRTDGKFVILSENVVDGKAVQTIRPASSSTNAPTSQFNNLCKK